MPNEEKFTLDDLNIACDDLATIPYFPTSSRASVIVQLGRMCPHKRALEWLTSTAVARCKQWPGMSELRGLLCSRFDAADGVDEPACSIPGFSAEEQEARFLERHEEAKQLANKPMAPEARELVRRLVAGAKGM